jgi:nucleoside phosphorylase
MLSHDEYTVGWICALQVELDAARAVLDVIHDQLPLPLNDRNTYLLGEISGHNVAITCLPSGVDGTNAAAVVAQQMKATFHAVHIRLMVGIGGGVPSSVDIRLGDIVVSHPDAGSNGVIPYDHGKAIAGGEFEQTRTVNKPPEILLKAIPHLGSHQICDSRMRHSLKYPGQEKDKLFQATYDHSMESENDQCDKCDKRRLLKRSPRPTSEPRVHYGRIASGNRVMKDGRARDKIAKEHKIICFEMEASGLMDHWRCLVIRGICDYADSHKNEHWQNYAAGTAAAYAKKLLSVVARRVKEPVKAVDLGASIIEFIEFATQLVTSGYKIPETAVDFAATIGDNDLDAISNNITRLSQKALDLSEEWIHGYSTSLLSACPADQHFHHLSDCCNDIARTILGALGKLRTLGSHGDWKSLLQGLETIWKKSEIDLVRSRLDQLRVQVHAALRTCLRYFSTTLSPPSSLKPVFPS